MDPQLFLDQAHFAMLLCLDLPSGLGKCRAGQPALKPNVVPPSKRYDTAQDGQGDDGSQNKKNYIIRTKFTKFNTGYIAGVGPLIVQ